MSLLFFWVFLATLRGLRDLSSLTRDRTLATTVKVPSPNHWTTREFPLNELINNLKFLSFHF